METQVTQEQKTFVKTTKRGDKTALFALEVRRRYPGKALNSFKEVLDDHFKFTSRIQGLKDQIAQLRKEEKGANPDITITEFTALPAVRELQAKIEEVEKEKKRIDRQAENAYAGMSTSRYAAELFCTLLDQPIGKYFFSPQGAF